VQSLKQVTHSCESSGLNNRLPVELHCRSKLGRKEDPEVGPSTACVEGEGDDKSEREELAEAVLELQAEVAHLTQQVFPTGANHALAGCCSDECKRMHVLPALWHKLCIRVKRGQFQNSANYTVAGSLV
jgi:hypothetical protein